LPKGLAHKLEPSLTLSLYHPLHIILFSQCPYIIFPCYARPVPSLPWLSIYLPHSIHASLYPCLALSLPCSVHPVHALFRPCLTLSLPHHVPALLRPCIALSMPCSFPAAPCTCLNLSLFYPVLASSIPCLTLSLHHSVPASQFLCLTILYLPCLLSPLLSFHFHVLHFMAFLPPFYAISCLSFPFPASYVSPKDRIRTQNSQHLQSYLLKDSIPSPPHKKCCGDEELGTKIGGGGGGEGRKMPLNPFAGKFMELGFWIVFYIV
jgi:hypothetical protein